MSNLTDGVSYILYRLMANNNVKMYEIMRMAKKRLDLGETETIQIFFAKKLISDLSITVKELRSETSSEPLELEITKMEVF